MRKSFIFCVLMNHLLCPLTLAYTGSKVTISEQMTTPTFTNDNSRRAFFSKFLKSTTAAITTSSIVAGLPNVSNAAAVSGTDKISNVYFGVGCFWHIQHEFIEAERKILGRSNEQLTSLAGYAGGKSADKENRVCYHNFKSVADYGKLGHGEVVGMAIPESKIGAFSKEYFSLFTPKGERVDPGDRGSEYRSLLGLPGGASHPMYEEVQAAATAKGMTLALGQGNDPDTFGKKLVYVMDSNVFPFYQAEVYHQYHNDFQSPPYGREYNSLADAGFDAGRIKSTMCPDRV